MKEYIKTLMILYTVATIILSYAFCTPAFKQNKTKLDLKEGDVVFQISKSQQSKYIQKATESQWGHCGIIVIKDNKIYVLEASKTVKLTPYDDWVKKGKDHKVSIKRYTNSILHINYSNYLDKPYDTEFKFNNNKWYCSELVYDIYKKQFIIEICKPKRVDEYNITGLENILNKRNIQKSQLVVAPSDLYNKGKLIF